VRLTELYVKHNTAGKKYDELFETIKFDTFLTAEEAVVLLQESSGIQYIPYQPNPYWTSNPDWTYDPNRTGQPWYTTTSNTPTDDNS
jgi:hypothetical protein